MSPFVRAISDVFRGAVRGALRNLDLANELARQARVLPDRRD